MLYGAANLSISAAQLAHWGSEWWKSQLVPIRGMATTPARIAGRVSGLTLGNWYCAAEGGRCHYLGHHEGFHHLLYWDSDRQVAVGMLSNNALDPALQQRLKRAIISFVNGNPEQASSELKRPLIGKDVAVGRFDLESGETIEIVGLEEDRFIRRNGIDYPAYPMSENVRYVPGMDLYLSSAPDGRLHLLSLYEDVYAIAQQ